MVITHKNGLGHHNSRGHTEYTRHRKPTKSWVNDTRNNRVPVPSSRVAIWTVKELITIADIRMARLLEGSRKVQQYSYGVFQQCRYRESGKEISEGLA